MITVPAHIVNFAGEANLDVYKAFTNYWNRFRTETQGATGLEFTTKGRDSKTNEIREISFSESEHVLNQMLVKEILRKAGITNFAENPIETWATHPMLRWASMAVVQALVDMILPQTIIDTIGLYTDVVNIGWGDSAAFNIKSRDLFVVSKAGRSKRTTELKKQFDGQVVILPEPRQITVFVNLMKVLAGKESLSEFVMKAVRSMETAITTDVYSTFKTALHAVDNTATTGLRVSGYTQAEFVRLSQTVTAWNQGAKAICIGTQQALSNILPSNANYRYTLESDLVRLGYVQNFQGTDIMVLPQVADPSTTFGLLLDDTRLYFLSPSMNKICKLVLEGNSLAWTADAYQNSNLTQESVLIKSFASGIATNAVAATIELS